MNNEPHHHIIQGKALERYFDLQNALLQFSELFNHTEKNDRAIVLIGASFLDMLLEHMLIAFLVDDEKEVTQILQPDRFLGTYSSKVSLLYCIGLINKTVFDDLRLIGKIRNKFAHTMNVSFDEQQISSWCTSLKWHKVAFVADPPEDATSRDIFKVDVNVLVSFLDGKVGVARIEKREICP